VKLSRSIGSPPRLRTTVNPEVPALSSISPPPFYTKVYKPGTVASDVSTLPRTRVGGYCNGSHTKRSCARHREFDIFFNSASSRKSHSWQPQLSLPVTLAGAGVAGDRTVGYQTSLVLLQIYIDHNIGNGDLTSFVRSYRLTGVCVSSHRIAREHS